MIVTTIATVIVITRTGTTTTTTITTGIETIGYVGLTTYSVVPSWSTGRYVSPFN